MIANVRHFIIFIIITIIIIIIKPETEKLKISENLDFLEFLLYNNMKQTIDKVHLSFYETFFLPEPITLQ